MKKLKQLILGVLLAIVLISCQSYKKVPYLQDMTQVSDTEQGGRPIGVKVMPKDLLTITVSCSTPELAAPFNLVNPDSESSAPQQYLVDNQGNINFPVLGEIHVGGLTKLEIENLIIEKLKVYLKEAPLYEIVTAGGKNFLLCHSGLDNFSPERSPADYTADELIWAWPELTDRYFDDCITVFGHTPTKSYGEKYNGKILKTDTWIDVDVGVPYGNNPCLLRLDDLKEFYL